jgi:hypothetical protein
MAGRYVMRLRSSNASLCQLLPTAAKPPHNGRQMWNIGRAHDWLRMVLDDVPAPTDLMGETAAEVDDRSR